MAFRFKIYSLLQLCMAFCLFFNSACSSAFCIFASHSVAFSVILPVILPCSLIFSAILPVIPIYLFFFYQYCLPLCLLVLCKFSGDTAWPSAYSVNLQVILPGPLHTIVCNFTSRSIFYSALCLLFNFVGHSAWPSALLVILPVILPGPLIVESTWNYLYMNRCVYKYRITIFSFYVTLICILLLFHNHFCCAMASCVPCLLWFLPSYLL
jgi:hypothetical protein